MNPRIIRSRINSNWIDTDGIAHSVYDKGAEEVLSDAQANIQAIATLRGDSTRRVPVLVDLRLVKSQTRDVRSYYASPEVAQVIAAVAMLVESRVSTLVGNFYLTVKPATTPSRIFTSEAEALNWLKGFVL